MCGIVGYIGPREAALVGFDISATVEEREKFERKFHGRLAQAAKSLSELGRLPDGAQGALVFLRDWASYSTIPLARVPAAETEGAADAWVKGNTGGHHSMVSPGV